LPPSAIYGRLHLGFALVLAGALAIYSVSRPRPGSLGAAE
jgi:hypothetical protein